MSSNATPLMSCMRRKAHFVFVAQNIIIHRVMKVPLMARQSILCVVRNVVGDTEILGHLQDTWKRIVQAHWIDGYNKPPLSRTDPSASLSIAVVSNNCLYLLETYAFVTQGSFSRLCVLLLSFCSKY